MDYGLKRAQRWLAATVCLAILVVTAATPAEARVEYHANRIDPELLAQILADRQAEYDVIVEGKPGNRGKGKGGGKVRNAGDGVVTEGGKVKFALGIVGAVSAELKGDKILKLTRDSAIDYISPNRSMRATFDPLLDGPIVTSTGVLAVNARGAWDLGATGRGVGVAVIDSGVAAHPDLGSRIVAAVDLTGLAPTTSNVPLGDLGGHGTHVAGIIAGDGKHSGGQYAGVAPNANIVDVRVIDANGNSNTSIVLRGMNWVLANKNTYNIKVVNMSLGSHASGSYKKDVMATAAEVLIFAGITVVVSAGNTGPGAATITSPANDPYVITVGAADDNGTALLADDLMATFSSRGRTAYDNLSKPDLVAPGRKIVSLNSTASSLATLFPERVVLSPGTSSPQYFTLSGTSMAAPMVTGTVALMLERNPTLTPAQIKKRLKSTATSVSYGGAIDRGAGLVNAFAAVSSISSEKEYSDGRVSDSFAKDMRKFVQGQPLPWKDLLFNGGLDSAGLLWSGVTWENITWDNVTWENISWESFTWENITWENATWEAVTWESTGALSGTGSGWDPVD